MKVRRLAVHDAFGLEPAQHTDERGVFLEWFRQDTLAETVGHRLDLHQANCSVSQTGALRGIHFTDLPPGQAKYVTCTRGSVLDVVVDVRLGSPTYGRWDSVLLDDRARRAVYLAEGLGHAFLALEADATVVYLCSAAYAPDREHTIDPLDEELGIDWPTTAGGVALGHVLSDKDAAAPSLRQAASAGMLPSMDQARALYDSLRR